MIMTSAVDFFYEQAGYGYDPTTETAEEGRQRGAQKLANAERWALMTGHRVSWQDDWELNHVTEYPDAYDQEPETCEYATMYDSNGVVVASLSCIDDATDDYRRVIEAELALEVMPEG